LYGCGTEKSLKAAFQWLEKSAMTDNKYAQHTVHRFSAMRSDFFISDELCQGGLSMPNPMKISLPRINYRFIASACVPVLKAIDVG